MAVTVAWPLLVANSVLSHRKELMAAVSVCQENAGVEMFKCTQEHYAL